VLGASGIHIVLPSYYAPPGIGLLDMNTSDGRFLFLLPWENHVLVGKRKSYCISITYSICIFILIARILCRYH
jgi:hypothetical protein